MQPFQFNIFRGRYLLQFLAAAVFSNARHLPLESNFARHEYTRKKQELKSVFFQTQKEIVEQIYQNISQELHDNIGQVLNLVKIHINTIDINLPEKAKEKLSQTEFLVSKAIHDVRQISRTLKAEYVESTGLSNAIEQQLELLRKTGLYDAQLEIYGEERRVDSYCELIIFRTVQELLNNIVKHAKATSIGILLEYHPQKIVLVVGDNGVGFNINGPGIPAKGMGLRNINNRIKILGGTVRFESESLKGAKAFLEIPV